MDAAEILAPMTLRDPEGSPVRLGERWADRPMVVAFVRHFG